MTQHCWPTTCNIAGPHMLCLFAWNHNNVGTCFINSLKPVKLLGPSKHMQHCWPKTPNNMQQCCGFLCSFAWALTRSSTSTIVLNSYVCLDGNSVFQLTNQEGRSLQTHSCNFAACFALLNCLESQAMFLFNQFLACCHFTCKLVWSLEKIWLSEDAVYLSL